MTKIEPDLRARLIAAPEIILDDREVMQALVGAADRAMGANVIDIRGIAMERLEAQLARLEETHRHVIAAAYDNHAGAAQVHRAVLHLLEAPDFAGFLAVLGAEVAACLRVDHVRLVLESRDGAGPPLPPALSRVLTVAAAGFVAAHAAGRHGAPPRPVTLRRAGPAAAAVWGAAAEAVGSEALLLLDLGPGRLPGLLALGAADPGHFRPRQGTDLLAFLAGAFERTLRRWLS